MDIDYTITITMADDDGPILVEIDLERAVEKACEEAGVDQMRISVERQ